jgi:signal transduction histidine kinase
MRRGGVFVSHAGSGDLDAAAVSLVALTTLPLLAWRRSPFGVFVVTATANVLLAAVVYPIGLPLGPAVALYLLAASRDEASPWLGPVTAAALALLVAYVAAAAFAEHTFPGFEFFHAGLLWSAAWFAGERARLRREQISELKREAQRERLLAAAEERTRIARDLHDSAGHAINVIAVRAGAARLRHPEDPDRSLLALEAIEDLARRTVDDIDRFVGALRDGSPGDAADGPPGLASLATLIAQHTDAGLDIARTTTGTPRRLASVMDQAAYRILQEALTNASRHGAGTAKVDVAFRDDALELRVTNPVNSGSQSSLGRGRGLVGMHERAAMLGGTLAVERHDGTFCVGARIPYETDHP